MDQGLREDNVCDYDLETLIRTYGNDVLRTAYVYLKDASAADDIFQEVFIKVDRNLQNFRGESNIKTWLIRITINACKDYAKSAYSRNVVPMMEFKEDAIVSENDFDDVERKETATMVHEAVQELPEMYKEVVMYVYFNEMSVTDTAKALNVAEGTIKSRLSRAREKLKEIMERRRGDEYL